MAVQITSYAPTFRPISGVHIFRKFQNFSQFESTDVETVYLKLSKLKANCVWFEIFKNFEKIFEKKSWFWHDDAAKC